MILCLFIKCSSPPLSLNSDGSEQEEKPPDPKVQMKIKDLLTNNHDEKHRHDTLWSTHEPCMSIKMKTGYRTYLV